MPPQSKRLQQQRAKSGICRYNAPRIRIGRIALSGRSRKIFPIFFAAIAANPLRMICFSGNCNAGTRKGA